MRPEPPEPDPPQQPLRGGSLTPNCIARRLILPPGAVDLATPVGVVNLALAGGVVDLAPPVGVVDLALWHRSVWWVWAHGTGLWGGSDFTSGSDGDPHDTSSGR